MPNTTGSFPMPYPNSSAVPDVPGDLLALAQEVDDTLTAELPPLELGLSRVASSIVIPTSVAGSGVSLDSNTGRITIATATSISVNGCFSAAFRDYEVTVAGAGSTNVAMTLRMRLAGTDASTAVYQSTALTATGGISTATSGTTINQTSHVFSAATSRLHEIEWKVRSPALAAVTRGTVEMVAWQEPPAATGAAALQLRSLYHYDPTAYDGFTITVTGGTFSGTLIVEGKRR